MPGDKPDRRMDDGNDFDPIAAMLNGEYVETGGLHFIATPDTEKLMLQVKDTVQGILDKAHKANPKLYPKRTVTHQVLEEYKLFANGEAIADIETSVRGKHVYYFSDPHGDAKSFNKKKNREEERSLNDKIMHDYLALGALKENGARSVNLVMQCMPYARQDKTTPGKRQAASMDRIGKMFSDITGENGYIMTMDLHNPASKSSFQGTNFLNLYSGWLVRRSSELSSDNPLNLVLAPADQGGYGKISSIAEDLKMGNTISLKTRDYTTENQVDDIQVLGDIEGKDVIIHDDILDTGGTLCKLLEKVLEKKPRSVNIAITHGLFNEDAFDKLANTIINSEGVVKKVYVTNSVNRKIQNKDWIETVDTTNILANNILSIFQGFDVRRGNDRDYLGDS